MSKKEKIFPLNTFGGRIQDLRKNILKISRPEFYDLIYPNGNVANESKSRTIKNWESGECEPDLKTITKICIVLKCSSDYLFGLDDCTTKNAQFIHDYTGLSEKSIDILQTEKYFKSSHCIEIINILLNDLWTHPESRNTKYSFINLFANYLRFCIDGNHKYALSKNGNIKIDPKPNMIDIDGKAMYSIADIHFTSEQLEKMFIMEIEDVLKALKESYIIQKQKAPDTN